MKARPAATVIITSLLILLFTYTALNKFLDPQPLKAVLKEVPVLKRGAALIALLLPLCELVVVLLLLFRSSRLWGLYGSAALLTLFTLYLVYMVLWAPHLPCSCGGVLSQMEWKAHIAFNFIFLVLALMAIRFSGGLTVDDSGWEHPTLT